jgi:hypothetical protein
MRHAGCHSNAESIVGDLTLGYEVFSPGGDKDLVVALDTAEPGSPPERCLHQLARWRSGHRPRSARTLPPSTVDQLPRSTVGTMPIGAATVISRGDHRSIALRWPGHSRDQLSSSRTRGMTCWPYSSMVVMSWSCLRPGMPYFRSNRVASRTRRFVAIFWATVSGDPT